MKAGPHPGRGMFGSVVEWLMAPGCKPGSRRRYGGSNPPPAHIAASARPKRGARGCVRTSQNRARALHNGNALAFQARVAGSIPAARLPKNRVTARFFYRKDCVGFGL